MWNGIVVDSFIIYFYNLSVRITYRMYLFKRFHRQQKNIIRIHYEIRYNLGSTRNHSVYGITMNLVNENNTTMKIETLYLFLR